MALPVTITGISTAVASVGPFKRSAGVGSAFFTISTTRTNNNILYGTGGLASEKLSQSFTTTGAVSVGSVSFYVAKNNSPTDNVFVDIYLTDGAGAPTGSSLGSSNPISGTTFATTATQTEFVFSTPVALSATTQYAAVLYRSGTRDVNNFYRLYFQSTNVNASERSADLGSSVWSTNVNDYNLLVKSYLTDAYYFFGRDGTTATTLQAFKSTAPDTSWASVATKTGFTTAILAIASYQVGNVIHLMVMDGTSATSVAQKYLSYDMATDTFLATTETVSVAGDITGTAASGWGCSLVVRSNGNVVTYYNGVSTKTSGTSYARVYYRERTGVNTYGTAVEVDANTTRNSINPIATLGASDRVHLFYQDANNIQRHLTSANVLGTAGTAISGTALIQDVVQYDDAGTIRIVGVTAAAQFRFNSADNPTISTSAAAMGLPARGVDDSGNPYFIYQNSSDSDLYIKTSTDDGATWGSATSALVGTVAAADANLSKNQRSYTRGSSVVVPYIVNDNGTLKYNEAVISSLAATGTGALAAQSSTMACAGVSASTGTGTPASQSSAVGSTGGTTASTGTSTLAAQTSAVSGLGSVSSAAVTGTGALAADAAVVSGVGVSASTGTGALAVQTATAAGAGVSASSGTGALATQNAAASGAGIAASTGTGALAAASATASGTGVSASVGTGALQAASATVVGAGASASTGTGSLVAGSAEVAGTGTAAAGNAGALVAQEATVAGLGISVSTGTGTVQAGAATVAGAGLGVSTGIGALVASPATVVGEGVVLDAGSIIGIGALVAGAATIAGEGDVTGEVAPPVSAAIGGHWRPEPHRPPPVEGVGYGILPELEGEAHGVVLVAGAGAALPRISGVGTGAVGVAGRSASTLPTVNAAAAGERGQVGAAVAVLRTTASGCGVAVARGSGSGVVLGLKGAAIGRHDDDEAAIVALLLAA